MPKLTVYLAGPIFSLAELEFNRALATAIHHVDQNIEVVLPQNFTAVVRPGPGFAADMYKCCLDEIEKCDVVVAVLDGADADSGTCIEIGYSVAKQKPIIGIRTDPRASEDQGLNLMVSNACTKLIRVAGDHLKIESLAGNVVSALRGSMA